MSDQPTHIDPALRQTMLRYYQERAPEYEEAYTCGTGTASSLDPRLFQAEARVLGQVVERLAAGNLLDVACGTGYWLPRYATKCSSVTLFDQSEAMPEECRTKVRALGIGDKCTLTRGDVFDYSFPGGVFDFALVGFLLSHLDLEQERRVFDVLRRTLKPSGRFLVLDSAWSAARAQVNTKVERQRRRLNDGTAFDIYKRYYAHAEVDGWAIQYGATIEVEHFGDAFLAASGTFS